MWPRHLAEKKVEDPKDHATLGHRGRTVKREDRARFSPFFMSRPASPQTQSPNPIPKPNPQTLEEELLFCPP